MTRSKYKNVKVTDDGHTFDSTKERDRYIVLRQWEREGKIQALELQTRYPLTVNGQKVCTYVADFSYVRPDGPQRLVVEDVKSAFTRKLPVYRLKFKLFRAVFGFDIIEV